MRCGAAGTYARSSRYKYHPAHRNGTGRSGVVTKRQHGNERWVDSVHGRVLARSLSSVDTYGYLAQRGREPGLGPRQEAQLSHCWAADVDRERRQGHAGGMAAGCRHAWGTQRAKDRRPSTGKQGVLGGGLQVRVTCNGRIGAALLGVRPAARCYMAGRRHANRPSAALATQNAGRVMKRMWWEGSAMGRASITPAGLRPTTTVVAWAASSLQGWERRSLQDSVGHCSACSVGHCSVARSAITAGLGVSVAVPVTAGLSA